MNYKVMSKAGASVWEVKHFETESEARSYANQCYKSGCNVIEIYRKTRCGFQLVHAHRESIKAAIERWADDVAESAPFFE